MAKILVEQKIRFTFDTKAGMFAYEQALQQHANQACLDLMRQFLEKADTNGDAILVEGNGYTSKGLCSTHYLTPWGTLPFERHVYQSSKGGAAYCPLEQSTRIVGHTTPLMISMIGHKYAEMDAPSVKLDLKKNHGIDVHINQIQRVANELGNVIKSHDLAWSFSPIIPAEEVKTLGLMLDGTCMLMNEAPDKDGKTLQYRVAMCGLVNLYDKGGNILASYYTACAPELGKETFYTQLDDVWQTIRSCYPQSETIGLSDGAREFSPWLQERTQKQILDFHHAAEYIHLVRKSLDMSDLWVCNTLHNLKNDPEAAQKLVAKLEEMEAEINNTNNPEMNDELAQTLKEKIENLETEAEKIEADLAEWETKYNEEEIEKERKKEVAEVNQITREVIQKEREVKKTKDKKAAEKLEEEIKSQKSQAQQHQDIANELATTLSELSQKSGEEKQKAQEEKTLLETKRDELWNNGADVSEELAKLIGKKDDRLRKAIHYIKNNIERMNYADYQARQYPIGSGSIEAACKSVIKERMCESGMRWKTEGASNVLAMRALLKSDDLWGQFWDQIAKVGYGVYGTKSAKWKYKPHKK